MKVTPLALLSLVVCLYGCGSAPSMPGGIEILESSSKAGKRAYDANKLKRRGGEKRVFSLSVMTASYETELDAKYACFGELRRRADQASERRGAQIISETFDNSEEFSVSCEIEAFVWP